MSQSRTRAAALVALCGSVSGAMLLGWAGCDGCGTTTESVYFDRFDYYLWAWERSGRTLAIQGVVPTAPPEVLLAVGPPSGAPCPPPADVVPYAREILRPAKTRATYRSIRAGSEKERAGRGTDCIYDYDDDYCPNDP